MVTNAAKVLYGTYGKFSGPYIVGTEDALDVPSLESSHWDRALWLTVMVESGGKLGSVMMADGTGVTAGIEQSILVYPKNLSVQGPLVGLLYFFNNGYSLSLFDLGKRITNEGWKIASDKTIRYIDSGKIVPPRVLRETVTPNQGCVPRKGPEWERSKAWSLAFHEYFGMGSKAQARHAIDGFTKYARRVMQEKLFFWTIEKSVYGGDVMQNPPLGTDDSINGMVNDLAMAMFWCYKTNAPASAMTCLSKALASYDPIAGDSGFGKKLLRLFGTSKYGRWATNRWKRSRQYAMKVWPKELFSGPDMVMPASF
jgi:hypothetical protein